jgi:ribosome-associated protein
MPDSLKKEIAPFLQAVSAKKAEKIVALNVGHLTSIADAFIICSGNSNRQVTAIADHTVKDLKKQGIKPLCSEGLSDGRWALLDYGNVIIHIFYETVREFYDIEGLWSDAEKIETTDI